MPQQITVPYDDICYVSTRIRLGHTDFTMKIEDRFRKNLFIVTVPGLSTRVVRRALGRLCDVTVDLFFFYNRDWQ